MIKCDDLETSTESMEKNEQSHFDSDVKNNLIPLQVTKKKILLEENSRAVEEESLQSKESTKIEGLKLLFLCLISKFVYGKFTISLHTCV